MHRRRLEGICRWPWSLVVAAGLVLLASFAIAENPADSQSLSDLSPSRDLFRGRDGGPAGPKPAERQREGTRLADELGTFEFVGDRVAFVPAGGGRDSYRVLENLALERIVRQAGDGNGQQEWVVSGVLTEFKAANYLLLTKAAIRSSSAENAR